MNAIKVLSQRCIGYRRQGSEAVTRTVWLMSDGSTQTTYEGNTYDYDKPTIRTVEYGTQCPTIDTPAQQEAQ